MTPLSRLISLYLFLLLCSVPSIASDLDDLITADQIVRNAGSLKELQNAAIAARFNRPIVRDGLAYLSAVLSMPDSFGQSPEALRYAVRLMDFVLLLEAQSRSDTSPVAVEPLYALGGGSLNALSQRVDIAAVDRPAYLLLSRWPEIRLQPWRGYYHEMEFTIEQRRIILEKSDTPWHDLTPEWQVTQRRALSSAGDSSTTPAPAASSYVLVLDILNLLIVAGKAESCADLTMNPTARAYFRLVASNAIYYASAAETSLKRTSVRLIEELMPDLEIQALRSDEIRKAFNFEYRLTSADLEPRKTAIEFFAGNLEIALRGYVAAAHSKDHEVGYRIYGLIGSGICQLALSPNDAVRSFQETFTLLQTDSKETTHTRYEFAAMADAFGSEALLGAMARQATTNTVLASWRSPDIELKVRYMWDLDVLRIFQAIDRPAAAAKLLRREITFVRSVRRLDQQSVEKHLLSEYGATMADLFARISWVGSPTNPRLRNSNPKEAIDEFAPTYIDTQMPGIRVPPGQKYGTVAPEEDRATCFELYDPRNLTEVQVIQKVLLPSLGSQITANTEPGEEFRKWVKSELERSPGRIKPLLKLVWVEWFYIPLGGLARPDLDIESWHYQPGDSKGVTTTRSIEAVITRAGRATDPEMRAIWEGFRDAHDFLLATYPPPTKQN